MLEVALSRRICCSRAWSVNTKHLRPPVVGGRTDYATRHLAHQRLAGAEIAQIRPTETQRDAERLGVAASDIRTPFAGSAQRSQIGRKCNS